MKESDLAKVAKTYKAKTRKLGAMAFTQISAGLSQRNKRKSGGILGEGGTVWEMAATSLHNAFLLDSNECHE